MGIGRDANSAVRHFNGKLDEVRILSRALTANEILEDYSLRGYYVDRDSTAAWYHLDEGAGASVADASGNPAAQGQSATRARYLAQRGWWAWAARAAAITSSSITP